MFAQHLLAIAAFPLARVLGMCNCNLNFANRSRAKSFLYFFIYFKCLLLPHQHRKHSKTLWKLWNVAQSLHRINSECKKCYKKTVTENARIYWEIKRIREEEVNFYDFMQTNAVLLVYFGLLSWDLIFHWT